MRNFAALLVLCGCVSAQSAPDLAFETASIKPFPPDALLTMSGCMGGPGSDDPARVKCEHVSLKQLLLIAYRVKGNEVFGPDWLDSVHFNIVAKVPPGATGDQVWSMYRNLLAERFRMVLHHETRPLDGYALAVAPGGPKLHAAAPPGSAPPEAPVSGPPPRGADGFPVLRASLLAGRAITSYRNGRAKLQGGAITISALADMLSHQLDQVVADETGLDGKYDVTLYWTPRVGEPGAPPVRDTSEASAPDADIFAALKQQLGLMLARKKIPRDAIVVDRAEKMPTEN